MPNMKTTKNTPHQHPTMQAISSFGHGALKQEESQQPEWLLTPMTTTSTVSKMKGTNIASPSFGWMPQEASLHPPAVDQAVVLSLLNATIAHQVEEQECKTPFSPSNLNTWSRKTDQLKTESKICTSPPSKFSLSCRPYTMKQSQLIIQILPSNSSTAK